MKVFVLSLLAISSVQSLTIGYPYRSGYWSYNPARGEFPVQSSVVQGYLRYIDNAGNERIIGYNYPEPVYGERQVSYVGGVSSPVYRTYTQDEFSEFTKARDAHFRVWSLQQYQALKSEIDALRSQGKEPSADMLLKFQPLEKIALTADYSTIAELPEIKRVREDHLQIWNKSRADNLQTDDKSSTYQQSHSYSSQGEIKTYGAQPGATLSTLSTSSFQQKPIEQQTQYTDAISELERAKQEHFRLWNEAKLRAEQASFKFQSTKDSTQKDYEAEDKQQFSTFKHGQIIQNQQNANREAAEINKAREDQLRLISEATLRAQAAEEHQKQIEQEKFHEQQKPIGDTPDVVRAREEHLRLVNEAKQRVELAEQQELKHQQKSIEQPIKKSELVSEIKSWTGRQDSISHSKAHEEHLRSVNEATLKIQAAEEHIRQLGAQQAAPLQSQTQSHDQQHFKSSFASEQQQIGDTPEVIRAREEHLRLVNEANLRAQQAEQQELKHKTQSIQQSTQQTDSATEFKLRSDLPQDSADHSKAREEHLRLVNEATLKIQAAEEHIKQLAGQQVSPAQTQTQSQFGQEQQHLKSSIAGEQQQVVDTPEVIKAREEHLRLVNEANLRAQQVEQQELKHTPQAIEQPTQQTDTVTEFKLRSQVQQPVSADHLKAREEHLRLVNEATLKIQAAEEHIKQLAAQQAQTQTQSQSHYDHDQQHLKSSIPIEQHQVVDTPEVIKAREEHLRLVSEANLRAQSVEQQELKYKQENKQESQQVPLLKTHIQHQPIHFQQPSQDTARVDHFRFASETEFNVQTGQQTIQNNLKSHLPQEYQHQQQIAHQTFDSHHHIEDTPEVQQAREEHLRIFNAIKSRSEQEESKMAKFKSSGSILLKEERPNEKQEILDLESTRLTEEQRQIEIELQRLKMEEQKQLELENIREAKRLAEEQQQMKDELERLRKEEEQRLEMERILEAKRLKEEQEELLKLQQLKTEESKQTLNTFIIPSTQAATKTIGQTSTQQQVISQNQQQQQYANNPYLRANPIPSGVVNRLQHSFNQQQVQPVGKRIEQTQTQHQQYVNNPYLGPNPVQSSVVHRQQHAFTTNPFFKATAIKTPIVYYPIAAVTSSNAAVQSSNTIVPVVRYVQSSQQSTGGNKQHNVKDDFVKSKYPTNTSSSQPADTAVALRALETATNEHFRAHELALEQLRLARLQNPKYVDCN